MLPDRIAPVLTDALTRRLTMQAIRIGDKVTSLPHAFTRITGVVVALHPANPSGQSAAASVYAGGYESVKVPLSDLRSLGQFQTR